MKTYIDKKGYVIHSSLKIASVLNSNSVNSFSGYNIFASSSVEGNPYKLDDSWRDQVLGTEEDPISLEVYEKNKNYNIPYNPDFIYIDAWLASSVEKSGPNTNGDAFEAEELAEQFYTWIKRGIYVDHDNDDVAKAIGIILSANYDPESERVRIIFAIPRKEYPDIVEKIENGEITDVSLGLIARSAECSVCKNIATGVGTECFLPGTLINTGDFSYSRIEDLSEGNFLQSHTLNERKILKSFKRTYEGKFINLKTRFSYGSVSTEEHPYLSFNDEEGSYILRRLEKMSKWSDSPRTEDVTKRENSLEKFNSMKPSWVKASELHSGDFLLIPKQKIPTNISLSEEFDPFSWLAGYYLGDGYSIFYKNKVLGGIAFVVNTNEEEIHTRIKFCFDLLNLDFYFIERRGFNVEYRIFKDKDFINKIYSLCGYNSHFKYIDTSLNFNLYSFLGGYLDSDGYVSDSGGSFDSVNEPLLMQIRSLLFSVDIPSSICKKYNKQRILSDGHVIKAGDIYSLYFYAKDLLDSGVKSIKLANRLPLGVKNRFFPIWKNYILARIYSVSESINCSEVYNFEVEKDNSYIANGFAVHNCAHVTYKGMKPGFYEINRGITGIECSVITDAGADVNAKMLKVFSNKENNMKITASWFGNVLLPVMDDLKAEGKDVSTREKALKALKETPSNKEIERYVASMSDKEYKELYSKFLYASNKKFSSIRTTASWIGHTFLPAMYAIEEDGNDVSTRDKALKALKKSRSDKDILEFVDSLSDKEYKELYTETKISSNKKVNSMKIEDFLGQLNTLQEAGFSYNPNKPTSVKGEEELEDSAATPDAVEETEDQIDLEVIEDNTNNDNIEDNAEEEIEDMEEDVIESEDEDYEVPVENIVDLEPEIEEDKPEDEKGVSLEEIEETVPDQSISEDPDLIGGVEDEEASSASQNTGPGGHVPDGTGPYGRGMGPGKGKKDGSGLRAKQVDSEATELQDEEFSPTEEIIEEIEGEDSSIEDAEGGEKLTSFLRTESFKTKKGDIIKSVSGKVYIIKEKPTSPNSVLATRSDGKDMKITCPRIFRFAGREGIYSGGRVRIRLPLSSQKSYLGFTHGKTGRVVSVGSVYASVDTGKYVLNFPYDVISGKKYNKKPGELSKAILLANRPVWAEDYPLWKKAVMTAKSSNDLTVNLQTRYMGMSKKDDPIKSKNSIKVNDKYYTLAHVYPVNAKVRFFIGKELKHSTVVGYSKDSIVLKSGRKVKASCVISEHNYMAFSNIFRKNRDSRTMLEKHWGDRVASSDVKYSNLLKKYEVLSSTAKKEKSNLLFSLRQKESQISNLNKKVFSLKKELEYVNPIVDLAVKKSHGVFSSSKSTSTILSYKKSLMNKSTNELKSIYSSIQNFHPKSDLIRVNPIKEIPSGGRSTKFNEFDSLLKDISQI